MDEERELMTKMNMVWVAVAALIYPETEAIVCVSKHQIDSAVMRLFGATITHVMINKHLVNSEDRQADRRNPQQGGSRNRYLVKVNSGSFRLYKLGDNLSDAWDKTGPTHPDIESLDDEYRYLVTWYQNEYINS